ncbi:Hypothetical protein FKW44_005435 [Caligus rogercresseyi]|uniref:Uncharacterized protein n=1 Tax=Caligus rogercresseyi TaxID=217165 RepID=A0A7T8QS15_CALRO|nr:Hypothetical protein FKW44_005435 [Caligus rogercresseyi]
MPSPALYRPQYAIGRLPTTVYVLEASGPSGIVPVLRWPLRPWTRVSEEIKYLSSVAPVMENNLEKMFRY